MLVLQINEKEDIRIGEDIIIRVYRRNKKTKIGIIAPKAIPVERIPRKEGYNGNDERVESKRDSG